MGRSTQPPTRLVLADALAALHEVREQITNERAATGLSAVHDALDRVAARLPAGIRDEHANGDFDANEARDSHG